MKHMPLLITLCVMLFSCNKDLQNEELHTTRVTRPDSEVLNSGNHFAFSLFKECYDSDTSSNLLISPFSLSIALGMTSNGAVGETQQEINKLLGVDGFSQIDINRDYQKTIELISAPDSMTSLTIANSIWFPLGYEVKKDFINQNALNFGAEIFEKDFSSNAIVDTVNSWVSDKTKGMIEDAIDKMLWSPLVRMYLVNTLYFKGQWDEVFDSSLTKTESFYKRAAEQIDCKMMQSLPLVRYYYENDSYQMVELNYKGHNYTMNIFLPKRGNLDSFVGSFDAKELYFATSRAQECRVDLKLPQFKVQSDFKLNEILKKMGMQLSFTEVADFSSITDVDKLRIENVLHKTYIKTDEIGTEATAATVVQIDKVISDGSTHEYENKTMHVNKPFLFTISHNESKSILFVGSVSSPE